MDFRQFPEDVVAALREATVRVTDRIAKDSESLARVRESYEAYATLFDGAMLRRREGR